MHVSVGCTSDHRSYMPLELLGAGSTCRSAMVKITVTDVVKVASDDLPTICSKRSAGKAACEKSQFSRSVSIRESEPRWRDLSRGFSCMFCTSIAY